MLKRQDSGLELIDEYINKNQSYKGDYKGFTSRLDITLAI
jgi:hypothetical protein